MSVSAPALLLVALCLVTSSSRADAGGVVSAPASVSSAGPPVRALGEAPRAAVRSRDARRKKRASTLGVVVAVGVGVTLLGYFIGKRLRDR
ncbi:MAG: hypothetical protein KF718_19035 [Polyangiaceae bacterium]|nr:hypothetical protein [Polyangiaceae bacterium]